MSSCSSKSVNVGSGERIASIVGGALLVIYGTSRRSLPGWLAGIVGGLLVRRGISGHCALYENPPSRDSLASSARK